MKRTANTTVYSRFNKETNSFSFAVPNMPFRGKSDFIAMCSQITCLSQEELPIIYANIRV